MDLEFIEDGTIIDIISIGVVAEDGREFYAINWDCDLSKANEWVRENVFPYLPFKPIERPGKGASPWQTRYTIQESVAEFLGCKSDYQSNGNEYRYFYKLKSEEPEPEIWTYFGAYDWVAFCQLFGTMINLPKGFPMYANDLKQWSKMLGDPNLPDQEDAEHNALNDAKWNKKVWEFLREYQEHVYDFSLSRL